MCARSFEANPLHVKRLHAIESCYRSRGWRTTFTVPRLVLDTEGETMKFNTYDIGNSGGGSSMSAVIAPNRRRFQKNVTSIDLMGWLHQHVFRRTLPPGFGDGRLQTRPTVVMKLDIEGAEYRVLPKLAMRGALCAGFIDYIYLEEHPQYAAMAPSRYKLLNEPVGIANAIKVAALDRKCTPVQVVGTDDETYGHDHLDDDHGWRPHDPKVYNDDLCDATSTLATKFKCVNSWWCKSLVKRPVA